MSIPWDIGYPFGDINRVAFGEQVIVDPNVPPGRLCRIPSANVVFVHPRDLLLMHMELCPTTYERKCTMRGQVATRIRMRRRQWTWDELSAWAGVPRS